MTKWQAKTTNIQQPKEAYPSPIAQPQRGGIPQPGVLTPGRQRRVHKSPEGATRQGRDKLQETYDTTLLASIFESGT